MFGNFSFMSPSPGQVSMANSFCLSFYLLYFVLPPFEENELPFWVPGVLRQHSVLWKFLSTQMIFWWTSGGESGLPILFLWHLRTAPLLSCFYLWVWHQDEEKANHWWKSKLLELLTESKLVMYTKSLENMQSLNQQFYFRELILRKKFVQRFNYQSIQYNIYTSEKWELQR